MGILAKPVSDIHAKCVFYSMHLNIFNEKKKSLQIYIERVFSFLFFFFVKDGRSKP